MLFCTYQNDRSIVCGKHQNPWREIEIPVARKESIPVLRRITGGGTVYHDLGNLVFTFIMKKDLLDRARNLDVVRTGLASFGIEAELTDGFDLYSEGSKISGSAFRFRRDRGIHHGTLLFDANRSLMRRVLKPVEPAIETYAVQSRPASTINLREIGATFSIEELKTEIERAVIEYFRPSSVVSGQFYTDTDTDVRVDEVVSRLRSWEWVFGNTPPFDVSLGPEPETLRLRIKKGRVDSIVASPEKTTHALIGCRFVKEEMISRGIGTEARRVVEGSTLL